MSEGLTPGLGLCLSGGGFRAMLFHVGGIRRLDELGLLDRVDIVSSVSGGSITSAAMALHWFEDGLDVDAVEAALLDLASHTLDVRAVLGAWIRLRPVSRHLASLYDHRLLHGRSLQEVPDRPTFVFNTTNMHTGNSFQWSKDAAHDYALGRIVRPDLPLSTVVAASSAFPPMLSPSRFEAPGDFEDVPPTEDRSTQADARRLWLTDGGVYDNLGLQPVDHFDTVCVSDGGAPFAVGKRLRGDWLSLTLRTLSLLQDQVGKRRRYEELYAPDADTKTRLIWSARDEPPGADDDPGGLPLPDDRVRALGATHTRLAKMPRELRYQLVNLGYALADRSVRPHLCPHAPPPSGFPHPGGIG